MTPTTYRNFDLLLTRAGERYRAFVVDAPAGEDSVVFDLPFAPDAMPRLGGSGLVRGASRHIGAADDTGSAASLTDVGTRLFEAIFQDKVQTLLAASLSSVAQEGAGLRLRLRFEKDAAGLATLPWETLYDPTQGHFVGLGEQSPILRYLSLPRSRSALLVEPPLRVLVVLSSPADLPPLNLEREWQAIQDALAGLTADGKFVLERLTTPTLAALQDRLLGEPVHILHFVGHGVFDEAAQAGCLVLEDARGQPHLVRGEQVAALLRNHPAMRLAYLNACEGALASGQSVFTGVAQTLVREGLPAAVAMQAEISDAGAVELARTFYTALVAGRPVDAALTQARVALSASGSPEWAIPVLFSRSPDNRLFDIRQVLPTPDCPYPGMTPFSEAQRDLFFGRDREIEDAVERLRQHPFLTVVGPSGSGKSSLVYAGVIPALRRSKRFGPGAWGIKIMRPGDSRTADGQAAPMHALAQLLNLSPQSPFPNPQFPTLLLVDQFEETFTLAGTDEAQAFLDALNGLIGRPNLRILLTVRADFYPELMASSLWQPIRANRLELTPLGDDALWAAIVEPAARVGVEADEALAVKLIADASGQGGVLPLVQETLVLLWDKVKGRRLKLEAYKEMGESGRSGLQVAIDRRATTVYHNLPDAAQPIARRIFLRLIQFGEGRADTRRQQTVAELRASGDDPALFDQTLAKLTESRLLTASGDAEGAERRVDIAHEALIAGWPRLQAWLDQRRAAEQTRRRLEAKAAEWVAAEKRGGLLDEYELQEAEIWLAGEDARELGYSPYLVDLVQASMDVIAQAVAEKEAQQQREMEQAQRLAEERRLRAEENEKATRSRQRSRLFAGGLALAMVVIALVGYFAWTAQTERNKAETAAIAEAKLRVISDANAQLANTQKAVAETAQAQAVVARATAEAAAAAEAVQRKKADAARVALSAIEQLGTDKERALILAVHAAGSPESWFADNALREVLASPGHTRFFFPNVLLSGGHPVGFAWSQSGRKVLIVTAQNELHTLDVQTGEGQVLTQNLSGTILQTSWGPDDDHFSVVTGTEIQVWSFQETRPIATAQWRVSPKQIVHSWSPDGSLIALGNDQGTTIWNWREKRTTPISTAGLAEIAWSADASYLSTLSKGVLRIWNATSGSERLPTLVPGPTATALWDPKESRLLIIGRDGGMRLWNAKNDSVTETALSTQDGGTTPPVHNGFNFDPMDWQGHVAWSPDGTRILTFKDRVQIWDSNDGSKIADLTDKPGNQRKLSSLTAYWSPDGMRVLIDDNQQVSIVYLNGSRNILKPSGLRSINGGNLAITQPWSADGMSILSAEGNRLTVWNAETATEIASLTGEADFTVTDAEWNPTGEYVLGANETGQGRVWDLKSILQPTTIEGQFFESWSPDGSYLITQEADSNSGMIRMWRSESPTEGKVLGTARLWNDTGEWSPEGAWFLALADGKTPRIWNALDWQSSVDLRGHTGRITSATWAPKDQGRLATASEDGSVRVWNAVTGELIHVLQGHKGAVNDVAWSPDGAYIASAGADATVRVWRGDTWEQAHILKGHIGAVGRVKWNPEPGSPLIISVPRVKGDTARMWNIQKSEEVTKFVNDGLNVSGAEWNARGTYVSLVMENSAVYLWHSGEWQSLPPVDTDALAWSPDGIYLAADEPDGSIIVWDAAAGAVFKQFIGHRGDVNTIDWDDPDGKRIVSRGADGKVRLWSLDESIATAVIETDAGGDYAGATFSPYGKYIALWTQGAGVLLYLTQSKDLITIACKAAMHNLGPADWQEFIAPQEPGVTCPDKPVPGKDYPDPQAETSKG